MEVRRDYYVNRLLESRNNGLVKIVTGIRRCGKSYLLFRLFKNKLIRDGFDESKILEMSFDDFGNRRYRNPDVFYEYILSQIEKEKEYVLLLDEVQLLDSFVDVLNGLLHRGNIDIYVTGSNARFLSHDVVTEFRGRGDQIHIQPFCFSEFMEAYDGSEEEGFEQYMRYGGLPPVVLASSDIMREDLLKKLLTETYITDIINRNNVKNDAELEDLLLILASTIGALTNPSKISATFKSEKGVSISSATLKMYIDYFADAFLLEKTNRYDVKGRHYIDTPLKYYFSDLGIRNTLLNFRQYEKTHIMENVIFNELCRLGYSVDVGVVTNNSKDKEGKSFRQQLEVDFVCNRGSERVYIQSAYSLPDAEKVLQETRSLLSIKDNFRKIVIVGDHTKAFMDNNGVFFINIYEFLMKGV